MAINILVVEDDPVQVELIAKIFKNSEYDYKWAPDVERAKALLAARFFSAILCDLNISGYKDGFELMRWIRDRDGIRDIPIIMITASANADTVMMARSIGIQGFLVKPFQPRALLKVLALTQASGQKRRVGTRTKIASTDELRERMAQRQAESEKDESDLP